MTTSILFSKVTIVALNGIAIALVVVGCLDFALFGHSLGRSRMYLVAALGTLTLAALVSRVRARRESSNQAQTALGPTAALPPLWSYIFVVLCFAATAITATTHLVESKIISLVLVTVMGLGLIAVLVNQARANARVGLKFSRIQKAGVLIAFIGLALGLIRLMVKP